MSTFLTILLVALLVVVAVVFGGLFWLRKKVRKAVGNYKAMTPYLIAPAARIKLRASAFPLPDDGCDEETRHALTHTRSLWSQLEAAGYIKLGEFEAEEDGRVLFAGQHPQSHIIAAAIYRAGMAPYFESLSLGEGNKVHVVSGEPGGRELTLPSLTVKIDAHLKAGATQAAGSGRAVDVPTMLMLIERVHAARMDSLLGSAPTLGEMQAQAALHHAAPLSAEQQERALAMNRDSWNDAVRIALLDNGRRKLKMSEDAWARLEQDLVVIHEGMNADEVIATLDEHELVAKLGEQLKRQSFTAPQIFDEINRRLDEADRRQLAVNVRFPVRARLFAPAAALRAAGISAIEVAA